MHLLTSDNKRSELKRMRVNESESHLIAKSCMPLKQKILKTKI